MSIQRTQRKNQQVKRPTTGNSDMAAKNVNSFISVNMADGVESPMMRFLTMVSSIKVSPSDCDRSRQPEMARLAPKTALLPFLLSVVVAVAWGYFL